MAGEAALAYSDNGSSCAVFLDRSKVDLILALMTSVGLLSVLLCTTAIVVVLVLRLYRSLVYRLASYQVLAALLYGLVCALQIFSKGDTQPNTPLCQATAFFMLCLQWVKLMFTIWVTTHLFCFAVFYKNLKRWETVYVFSSIFVPVVISVIPFTTGSYGLAGAWCWIQNWKDNCPLNISRAGVIEQFTLWYGPALFVFVVDSIAVVIMAIVLVIRLCAYSQVKGWKQHKQALTQMLPLLAYPITYTVLLLVPIVTRVYMAHSHDPSTIDYALLATSGTCIALWGLAAGIALLIHICVMKKRMQHKSPESAQYRSLATDHEGATFNSCTSDANTFYEPPRENELGDLVVSQ